MNCDDCRQRLAGTARRRGRPRPTRPRRTWPPAPRAGPWTRPPAACKPDCACRPGPGPPPVLAERIVAGVLADRRRQRPPPAASSRASALAAAASSPSPSLLPKRTPHGSAVAQPTARRIVAETVPSRPDAAQEHPAAVAERERGRGDLGRGVAGPAHRGRDGEQRTAPRAGRVAADAAAGGAGAAAGPAGAVAARGGTGRRHRPGARSPPRPGAPSTCSCATCRRSPPRASPACNRRGAHDITKTRTGRGNLPMRRPSRLLSPLFVHSCVAWCLPAAARGRAARRTAPPRPRRRGLLPGRAATCAATPGAWPRRPSPRRSASRRSAPPSRTPTSSRSSPSSTPSCASRSGSTPRASPTGCSATPSCWPTAPTRPARPTASSKVSRAHGKTHGGDVDLERISQSRRDSKRTRAQVECI